MLTNSTPLHRLYSHLNEKLGKDQWIHFEPETIIAEVDSHADPFLLREKVLVLQLILREPDSCMSSDEFIIHACQVANNEPAEFEMIAVPNSLEMAYFLYQIAALTHLSGTHVTALEPLKLISEYVLMEDGFSEPCEPFKSMLPGVKLPVHADPSEGYELPTPQDSANRAQAVQQYIARMLQEESI